MAFLARDALCVPSTLAQRVCARLCSAADTCHLIVEQRWTRASENRRSYGEDLAFRE